MNKKADVPRTMDNCLIDGKCDNCKARLTTLLLLWVWREYICCSKSCVVAAVKAGDDARKEYE